MAAWSATTSSDAARCPALSTAANPPTIAAMLAARTYSFRHFSPGLAPRSISSPLPCAPSPPAFVVAGPVSQSPSVRSSPAAAASPPSRKPAGGSRWRVLLLGRSE